MTSYSQVAILFTMTRGPSVSNATADGLGETIGGMFDIPEMGIVEQAEGLLTIGDEVNETTDPSQEEQAPAIIDPLADFF